MIKKKFIFENEEDVDINEMSDYEKLIRLAKHRISARDVFFETSDGDDFGDIIEETHDGLIFTFDGLKQFLQFFFPYEFSEKYNTEGDWQTSDYESMYDDRYNWYDDISDNAYQDWSEGYLTQYLTNEHLKIISDIARFISPDLYYKLSSTLKKGEKVSNKLNIEIKNFLELIDVSESIIDDYIRSSIYATTNELKKGIEERYCDSLRELGIERYSTNYCFWKYEMDWGSCLILFARFGDENDNFLDLLFKSINKNFRSHLPEPYEMRYQFWSDEDFHKVWDPEITTVLEKKLESIESDTEYQNEEYFDAINKVQKLGGLDKWIVTNDEKYKIRINNIDPSDGLVNFSIARKNEWQAKTSETDIDSLINIITNEKLFDILEHKKRISILRNKTFL